jgi:hypothetical protein
MGDEVVSHGFHPEHPERLAAYPAEAVERPSRALDGTNTMINLCQQ